jgi:magnesium transporter
MLKEISSGNVKWIDITTPTEKDLDYLNRNFDLHSFILKSVIPPIRHPRFEKYDDYLFMVLQYPFFNEAVKETQAREIDIIVTKNTIITVHYNNIAPLQALFTKLSLYEKERKEFTDEGIGEILYRLLNDILRNSFPKLSHIDEKIDNIEKRIFTEQKQKEVIEEISILKYDLLNFKRIVQPQINVFQNLKNESENLFGETFVPYFNELVNCFLTIKEVVDTLHRTLNELEETNGNLLSIKTNEIIKVLTIFTVIIAPLTLLASIWGMNINSLPFIGKFDFEIILSLMGVLLIATITFIKTKKWL